jgi:hypothetical protein
MHTTLEGRASESTPSTVALSDLPLDQLAADINRAHEAAECGMRESLLHAKLAGEKLIEAKAKVGHGNWMLWREMNCCFSHSTALLYMNVAQSWAYFVSNSQPVENLTLHMAADLLAKARREAQAEERAALPWGHDLQTTMLTDAQNRLRGEVSRFWERLAGGKLYADMGIVLTDSQPDDYELVNIVQSFNELRHRVDRCIEALRRRMDDASITWEKPTQTVFSVLE